MGIRPRSPGARPAPSPGSAKRPRLEGPAGPESPAAAPGLEDVAHPCAAPGLASKLLLTAGCALQLPLEGGGHLLLEPAPDSVLEVTLQDHALVLVSHDLRGSAQHHSAGQSTALKGLDAPGAPLGAPLHHDGDNNALDALVFLEQQGFCASGPATASQEEVQAPDDARPEVLAPSLHSPAGFAAGLLLWPAAVPSHGPQSPSPEPWPLEPLGPVESGSPGLIFHQDDFHLLRPGPSSPLQPLPAFPTPWPHERPGRLPGPHPKARRRLFQE